MNGCFDRLLLLSASNRDELLTQLASDRDLLTNRDDVQGDHPDRRFRLAILNADTRKLELAQRIVAGGIPWRGRKDVWFTDAPLLGKLGSVALIFPGLEQQFEPMLDDVAAHFGLPQVDLSAAKGSVREHSISLLNVGSMLGTALQKIGVRPAVAAGHSIGEWSAMMWAGLISSSSMESFIVAANPAVFELPDCMFLALGCGVDVAREVIAGIDEVVVSHDNCPHQSILCGRQAAIDAVLIRLKQRGVSSRLLNFRSGFHTSFLQPHLHWVSKIAELPLEPRRVPVWSATTVKPFPDREDEVREIVIRHLLEPVRFRELIENLYASGVRAFVQAGVGSLTSFIDDTLSGREYVSVAASVNGQPGMRQLRRTAAALWVEGAQLHLEEFGRFYSDMAADSGQVSA
jgi:acyl transferase domain-containing protein